MTDFFNNRKIRERDLLSFTRGMYYLLNGKVGVTDSLDIVSLNYRNNLKEKITRTRREIEKGTALNRAFSKITGNSEFLGMIKIGEETGRLDKSFKNLYEKYEFRYKIRKEVKTLGIYPLSVIITASIIVFILLKTVIPKFKSIYSDIGQELPGITRNIINISEFTDKYWLFIIFFLILLIFLIYYSIKKNKAFIEKIILNTGIIGKLYKEVMLLNFTRNMYSLLDSDIPMTEALELCRDSGSIILREDIGKILKKIRKGESIRKAFGNSPLFDKEYTSFLNIGEKTGNMALSFLNLNEIYYERVNGKIKMTLKIMEPASIIIVGLMIGFIIYSVMLPIFRMGEMI